MVKLHIVVVSDSWDKKRQTTVQGVYTTPVLAEKRKNDAVDDYKYSSYEIESGTDTAPDKVYVCYKYDTGHGWGGLDDIMVSRVVEKIVSNPRDAHGPYDVAIMEVSK